MLAVSLCWRGYELLRMRRRSEARTDLLRAHAVALSTGDDEGIAYSDQLLGDLALAEGDLDTAAALLIRARDRYRRSRVTIDAGYTLIDLARVRLAQLQFAEALTVAGEALADFRGREDPRGVAERADLPRAGVRRTRSARPRASRPGRGARARRTLGLRPAPQCSRTKRARNRRSERVSRRWLKYGPRHVLKSPPSENKPTATLVSPRNCGDPESPVHSPPLSST